MPLHSSRTSGLLASFTLPRGKWHPIHPTSSKKNRYRSLYSTTPTTACLAEGVEAGYGGRPDMEGGSHYKVRCLGGGFEAGFYLRPGRISLSGLLWNASPHPIVGQAAPPLGGNLRNCPPFWEGNYTRALCSSWFGYKRGWREEQREREREEDTREEEVGLGTGTARRRRRREAITVFDLKLVVAVDARRLFRRLVSVFSLRMWVFDQKRRLIQKK